MLTTGSTGEPLTIYKVNMHQSWFIAGAFLGWKWAGWEPGDGVLLPRLRKPALKETVENRVFNYKIVPIPELNEAYYRKFVEEAPSFRPSLIRAIPFHLYRLARYLRKADIRGVLKGLSQTLFTQDRSYSRNRSGRQVYRRKILIGPFPTYRTFKQDQPYRSLHP